MRVSWKWLSEMVDLSGVEGPQGLAELLTRRGLEVEEVLPLARGFEHVVTAKILERNPHPQADRLSLCKVTLGAGEPLEIVCGAQNMKAGDTVALAQVGAHLPNGLKIERSKIRGVVSNGMLCSEEELGLKAESEGILILPQSTPLGRPLAEVLGRDDTVLVLKLTANRGDCMSHYGLAREIGAALGRKPRAIATADLSFAKSPIAIRLDAGDSAPQFYGCLIEGVKIGSSPEWLVRRLEGLGSRSINNVVDATNLVMLELGHPTHAYDADRIEGGEIRVRIAKEGEELPLLDGQTVKLAGSELVIADGRRAVGLAGVMGGGNSEVSNATTRVFLECAEFAPTMVRRTAFKHQRRTEAAQRFEKGIDPAALPRVISRLAKLIAELAGGRVVGAGSAALPSRDSARGFRPAAISVNPGYFGAFLGMSISPAEAEAVLTGLDCEIRKDGANWTVIPPSYRLDLRLKEDLAEELARSVGYDRIPSTVPPLTGAPTPVAAEAAMERLALLDRAKNALVRAGLLETISFGFNSRAWLAKTGFPAGPAILNPLSEEHEVLVPSLVPGLIQAALHNWRHHFGSESLPIRLFEIRPTFHANSGEIGSRGEMETGVEERWKIAFALSGPRFASGLRNEQGEVDFYDLKAVVEGLLETLGARGVRFQPLGGAAGAKGRGGHGNPQGSSQESESALAKILHPGQAVEVLAGNQVAGYLGLLHPGKARELKTRAPLWLGELDWAALSKLSRAPGDSRAFKEWPQFPPMERDFALLVRDDVTADKITQLAIKAGKPIAKLAKVFDIYRGSQVAEGMTSVAVRVIFFDEARVLQETETEAASARILESWKKELGAELRG